MPYWEWGALDGDAVGHREYLTRGLDEAMAVAGGVPDDIGAAEAAVRPSSGPTGPLGYNEFRSSVKGQGLSIEEVIRMYQEQKSRS